MVDTVEEEVSSYLGYCVVSFRLKITDRRPQYAGDIFHPDVIWYVTSPISGCQPYQSVQSSIFVSTEEEHIQLFPAYKFYFHLPIVIASGISINFFTRFTRIDTFIQFYTSISVVSCSFLLSVLYPNHDHNHVWSRYL